MPYDEIFYRLTRVLGTISEKHASITSVRRFWASQLAKDVEFSMSIEQSWSFQPPFVLFVSSMFQWKTRRTTTKKRPPLRIPSAPLLPPQNSPKWVRRWKPCWRDSLEVQPVGQNFWGSTFKKRDNTSTSWCFSTLAINGNISNFKWSPQSKFGKLLKFWIQIFQAVFRTKICWSFLSPHWHRRRPTNSWHRARLLPWLWCGPTSEVIYQQCALLFGIILVNSHT